MRQHFDNILPPGNVRVMVCEDDTLTRQLLAEILTAEGYVVTQARSGSQAIDLLETEAQNLLLLDLMMPGDDGFQVLDFLRTLPSPPRAIVMTGMEPNAIQRRMSELQLKELPALFLKPIDPDLLLNFVAATQSDPDLQSHVR